MMFAFAIATGALLILYRLATSRDRPWARFRPLSWVTLGTCLLVLAGCGSSSVTTPPPRTPVSTPVTPAATDTPTQATTTSKAGDWTMYHNDNARTGYIANFHDPKQLTSLWNKALDGAVYAEPLVVGGHLLVATEHDTIYSFDMQSGKELWHTNVGTNCTLWPFKYRKVAPSRSTPSWSTRHASFRKTNWASSAISPLSEIGNAT